ncbi:MAG: hypothetical protein ACW98F_17580, partial [Candidatus Hodarchaeales archaeon]
NYTGVPLYQIIEKAQPKDEFFDILLRANDYSVVFNSTEVEKNDNLIVVAVEGGLKLVAAHYHGSYWIKKINSIVITTMV